MAFPSQGSEFLLGNPAIRVSADIAGFRAKMREAGTIVDTTVGNEAAGTGMAGRLSSLGTSFQRVGTAITLAMAPLGAAAIKGVNYAADFQASLAEIEARAQLTDEQINAVREASIQMGQDSAYSATEASQAMLELIASGSTVEEALAMTPHVLNLASASGMGLKQTADGLTNTMKQYGLEVENAEEITNLLVAAAASGSANVPELIEALDNGGAAANIFGMDLGETLATLVQFAEGGKVGSEAGTLIKSMLLNMTADTDRATNTLNDLGIALYDTEGNALTLAERMDLLTEKLPELTDQARDQVMRNIGGAYGITGLGILTQEIGLIDDTLAGFEGKATAEEIAAGRLNTFEGKMKVLTGTLETAMINVFTPFMEDFLEPAAVKLTEIGNAVADWAARNPDLTKAIILGGGALAGLGAALAVVGTGLTVIGPAITMMQGLSKAPLLSGLTSMLGGGLILPIAGVAAAGAGMFAYQEDEGFREQVDNFLAFLRDDVFAIDFSSLGEDLAGRLAEMLRNAVTGAWALGKQLLFGKEVEVMEQGTVLGTEMIPGILQLGPDLISLLGMGLRGALDFVIGFIPKFAAEIGGMIPPAEELGALFGNAASSIYQAVRNLVLIAWSDLVAMVEAPAETEGSAANLLAQIGEGLLTGYPRGAGVGRRFR